MDIGEDVDEVLRDYRYPQSLKDLGYFYLFFGPLAIITNVTTFVVIYLKTPLTMKSIRGTLLIIQVILILMDIAFFVCRPFAFIPHILIIVYGFFDSNTSINLQLILLAILLYIALTTTHILLYQRLQTLLKSDSFFKLAYFDGRYLVAINAIFSVTAIPLFLIFVTSNQESSREYFLENHPWSHEIITNRAACVIQIRTLYHSLVLFIVGLGVTELFAAFIVSFICLKLAHDVSSNTTSKQARIIQKQFTYVVIAQVIIPSTVILMPVCLTAASIFLNLRTSWNGILIEIGIISISLFATISSLSKIASCYNYRSAIMNLCCKTKVYSV